MNIAWKLFWGNNEVCIYICMYVLTQTVGICGHNCGDAHKTSLILSIVQTLIPNYMNDVDDLYF